MANQQLKAHCEDVIANPQDHLDWVVDMAKEALAALTHPASPALRLPDEAKADSSDGDDVTAWIDEGWNACLTEVKRLNAPHTAPIEPICATGGAEWVRVSERMPESKPGMWSKEVVAVSELGDVFKLSAMGKYWQRSKAFVESGAKEITHWMPLPAAPKP